jgi:hypothetical protein
MIKIKEDEMSRTSNTLGKLKKCIKIFSLNLKAEAKG